MRETVARDAKTREDAAGMERESATMAPSGWAGRLVDWAYARPLAPLLIALVLAVAVRALLVLRTHAMIDADEALVGIQAEHILRGERPTYFYGQAYMGSLEAYLAAALFRVFGPSPWTLRAVPVLLSLALVYLTWRLAWRLLPEGERTTPLLAGLAALFAAVPPLYAAVAELRTWGGQIEVYVVSVALLLATVGLRQALSEGASVGNLAWRWGIWGLLAGLGIWINPLISYALVACVLWLIPVYVERFAPSLYRRITGREARVSTVRPYTVLAAVVGLALGGLPAWIYAAQYAGENLLVYVSQPSVDPAVSGAARHGQLFLHAAIAASYGYCVAPRTLSGQLPAESALLLPLRALLLVVALGGVGCALWLVWRRLATPLRVGLPLLYAGVVTAVFCLGTSAWAATKACGADLAGRYAVPLVLSLPFLLVALFAAPAVWFWLRVRRGRSPLSVEAARRGWALALAALLLATGAHALTYGLADPRTTFQSPYYRRIALDQRPLLDYLAAHNIQAAWANHWIGNIVTFETDGRTTCADYYDQAYKGGIPRPPGTLAAVGATERPSFILISTDAHPALARALDAQGIAYTVQVIPQSGVTVITPERTVDPATVIDALGADYAS